MKNLAYPKKWENSFFRYSDGNDTYDCYEFERTMKNLQPYLSSLTKEQQKQLDSLRMRMIKQDAPPKEIIKAIVYKIEKFNDKSIEFYLDHRIKTMCNS